MNLSEALAEASKWGNLIRALSTVQDVLQAAGAQEQLKGERTAALAKLVSDTEAAKAAYESAKADLAGIKEQGDRAMSAANAAASRAIADAQAAAKKIIDDASQLRTDAEAKVSSLKAELAQLKDTLNATSAEHESLLKRLASAKDAARKLLA